MMKKLRQCLLLSLTLLSLGLPLVVSSQALAYQTQQSTNFPAVGKSYQVDFGGDNAFLLTFKSDSELTFKNLKGPSAGNQETVRFTAKKIREDVYMLYWQEADKTTVVHVQDYAKGTVYTNITGPDGSFYHGLSSLTPVNPNHVYPIPGKQQQNHGLKTTLYNPGKDAMFAVSSVLVTGAKDAVLIDAQFSAADARKLVSLIKASGKRLTTIYISHGDPDYYFGLDTLKAAFPNAKILATPQTIAHIQATQADKLKVWGPELGDNAPKKIIIPDPLWGYQIDLEGNKLEIIGLNGPTPDRTFVWIPCIKTVVGGIPVDAGEHVWMADTQTAQSHKDWLTTLDRIIALYPTSVIPGHYIPGAALGLDAVHFTANYIKQYDIEASKARNSTELIAAMKAHYPNLEGVSALELSAKVTKGEMKWP